MKVSKRNKGRCVEMGNCGPGSGLEGLLGSAKRVPGGQGGKEISSASGFRVPHWSEQQAF